MDLTRVLFDINPSAIWTLNDNDYDQLVWLSPGDPPTLQECQLAWVDLERKILIGDLRKTRNEMLSDSDWTQSPDADVDKKAWATYRQALRALPANTEDPRNPVWPSKP